MLIASFDIGKKNFAFVVERVDECRLINSIPLYPKRGKRTRVEFETFLEEVVFPSSEIVLHKNLDLTQHDFCKSNDDTVNRKVANGKGSASLDHRIFLEMYRVLDEYSEIWDECEWVLVEQQMSFGKKVNSMALKLGQHCMSYFIGKYRDTKKIIEFPSYHKTKVLEAPMKMDKPTRKKWSIDIAFYVLCLRGDYEHAMFILSSAKRDDLADVVIQLQAWKILYYFEEALL